MAPPLEGISRGLLEWEGGGEGFSNLCDVVEVLAAPGKVGGTCLVGHPLSLQGEWGGG